MKRKIGVVYSTIDGQTKKICEELIRQLNGDAIKTELYSIEDFQGDLLNFDDLIIGGSIRYGKHNQLISDFVVNNKADLKKIRTAFFSVNLVARKDNKNSPDTNPYMIKFLKKVNWKPDYLAVFAGKLDYKSYSWIDRIMIKLIMRLTDGPVKSDDPIEYTDWDKVKGFGKKIRNIQ